MYTATLVGIPLDTLRLIAGHLPLHARFIAAQTCRRLRPVLKAMVRITDFNVYNDNEPTIYEYRKGYFVSIVRWGSVSQLRWALQFVRGIHVGGAQYEAVMLKSPTKLECLREGMGHYCGCALLAAIEIDNLSLVQQVITTSIQDGTPCVLSNLQKIITHMVRHGRLHMLQWVYSVLGDVDICEIAFAAAKWGRVAILHWIHSLGVLRISDMSTVCSNAVAYGHINVLQFGHTIGVRYDMHDVIVATMAGQTAVVNWLAANYN